MQSIEMQKTDRFYIFKVALVASAGGFLFGFDFVIISGALSFLDAYFHLFCSDEGISRG